jgi:hypothetical protein
MAKVNDGSLRIRASEWPFFLYYLKTRYDPDDEEKGLLRGYILLRVCPSPSFNVYRLTLVTRKAYRHIFTGPSSAFNGSCDTMKASKAEIHNLTRVTGRTIAYAAVQVRISFFIF